MNIDIRRAREEDAASMLEILNPIIRAGALTAMERELTLDEQIAFIRGFPPGGVFHVAIDRESGRVVGMQDVMPHRSELQTSGHVGEISTFVALDAWGRGIGARLTEATLRAARELGFLTLTASIRADNPRAVGFYQAGGFRIVGTSRRDTSIGGVPVDEILAELLLDDVSTGSTDTKG